MPTPIWVLPPFRRIAEPGLLLQDRCQTGRSTADGGLYMAKQAGRDRVTIGDPAADLPSSGKLDGDGYATQAGRGRPSMHEAADEEDPHPSGLEIR